MLSPSLITFITIFGGLFLALFLVLYQGLFRKRWPKSPEAVFAIVANCMTLGTIGSFLYNTGFVVIHKSFIMASPGSEEPVVFPIVQSGVGINGNEATAFFAFLYAGGMIAVGIWRNLK